MKGKKMPHNVNLQIIAQLEYVQKLSTEQFNMNRIKIMQFMQSFDANGSYMENVDEIDQDEIVEILTNWKNEL